jgi:ADP-ribosylation factor related protein 1
MFSLLSGFYEYVFSKPIFKVLIVGLDGAGKTTLLEHIKQMEG